MDLYGIKILENNLVNFDFDRYYKNVSLKLKSIKEKSKLENERIKLRHDLSKKIKIEVDFETLKDNFINLLKDENSSKFLWLLYSKYEDDENYLDKLSLILKEENKVFRAGINLYKLNGWMTHSLYVYQIVNYNVAKNIPILNFNSNAKAHQYVKELHTIYENLSSTGKFILKVLSLIHDIGVIEDVSYHNKVGVKYVNQVLNEIGITQKNLGEFDISYNDLKIILEQIIKYHTIMSLLSGENSDECVETYFKDLFSNIPQIEVKKEIAKIMYIFTFGDIIAVNEILMDEEKFQRLKNAYTFFEEIISNKKHTRDKSKVALERLCDKCGKKYSEDSSRIDEILKKFNIEKKQFMENIYNVKWLHYTGPLMKTVNNLEISIHVLYEVTELVRKLDNENSLQDYIITFEPSRPSIEYDFLEVFENGDFFKSIELAKENKKDVTTYKKVKIEKKEDEDGKHLSISIME